MGTKGEATPPTNDANNRALGERLRASTVEALKEDLERQKAFGAQFLERYFPEITARGSVDYSDIDHLTPHQADAMAYSLARSIRQFKKDAGRQRARGVTLLKEENGEDEGEQYEIKARQYAAAVRDLCTVFGLEAPL
jgi:hypothetical protein